MVVTSYHDILPTSSAT
jgi:hypothetical protein